MPYKVAGTMDTAIRTFKNPFPFRPLFPFYCPLDSSVINDIDYDLIQEETLTNYCEFETEYEVPVFEATEPADPSTLDPYWDDVVLYLQGNGNSIVDTSSSGKNVSVFGTVATSSVQKKYGDKSLLFNRSTANYLTLPASTDWQFTGNFTVEGWFYWDGVETSGGSVLFATGGAGSTDQFGIFSNSFYGYGGTWGAIGNITNQWTHLVVSRSGSSIRAFKNGVQLGSTVTNSNTIGQNATLFIGKRSDNNHPYGGYIDSLRITKGVARYTANFNPEEDTYMGTNVQIGTQNTTIFDFAQAP